ncbi:hypothetical protein C8R47DRAFT_1189687 [Mycena vitilis]|nr:hypothetical protein C8R47DRAFT_1189687 [Mycena vitilis]
MRQPRERKEDQIRPFQFPSSHVLLFILSQILIIAMIRGGIRLRGADRIGRNPVDAGK